MLALAAVTAGPDSAYQVALADLAAQAPADRPYLRYLSLGGVPAEAVNDTVAALNFWVNSLSFRRQLVSLAVLGRNGPELVRLDLRSLGWDRETRKARLEQLKALGVQDFLAKDEELIDPWEATGGKDPYYFVSGIATVTPPPATPKSATPKAAPKAAAAVPPVQQVLTRGWLNPQTEAVVRGYTSSRKPILRADWFLAQTALEAPLGVYSTFLLLPKTEKQLYTAFGVDEKRITIESLSQGGAVLKSIVALHNRELELLPALYGYDDRFLWRSHDVVDNLNQRNVLRNFLGSIHADGREFIGSLPNGLHYYYLANGQGGQVGEVPTNIAQDRLDAYDTRVISAYKCVGCHVGGINEFTDIVSRLALRADVGLAVITKYGDTDGAKTLGALEDYYLSDVGRQITRHRESYAGRIRATNGLDAPANSAKFTARVNAYLWGKVDLAQAALELGCLPEQARRQLRDSGAPEALAIAAGEPVGRDAWEKVFAEVMKAAPKYPWEN